MNFEPVDLYLFGTHLRVYPDGSIERLMKSGNWKYIENKANHRHGYNVIMIKGVQHTRARIVAYAFLNMISLTNKSIVLHHKDSNRLNCSVANLSIESYSSINYYRKDTQGFYKNPNSNTSENLHSFVPRIYSEEISISVPIVRSKSTIPSSPTTTFNQSLEGD